MKLESQVVSLELSKRLKELGAKQESYFQWFKYFGVNHTHENDPYIATRSTVWAMKDKKLCSAFTVAELLSLLEELGKESVLIPLHPKEASVADYLARHVINRALSPLKERMKKQASLRTAF